MIIVELAGGLGNQMFQYAYGRSIALKHNTDLFLDLRFMHDKNQGDGFTYRDYSLSIFKIKARTLEEDLFNEAEAMIESLRSKLFRKVYPPWSDYLKESTKSFHQGYNSAKDHVYLRGYWQNPRYFKHIAHYLKNELVFPSLTSLSAIELNTLIKANNPAVAVHVRRGDYATIPSNLAACTPDYYAKAFAYFKNKVNNARYFIFSDEPQWVKENLELPENSFIVAHSTPTADYEDMYLMNQCQHQVIANSSFSWWGAWLANYENQIVIAPKIWDGQRKSEDICEPNWILS